ncbi:MAG: hypothetical protein IT371_14695 [Deltaproteobacteria bacterium]|nr:hypothetical protein [Deltaproteobacteria bacterium]
MRHEVVRKAIRGLSRVLVLSILLAAAPAMAGEKSGGFLAKAVERMEQRLYARVNPARVPLLLRPIVDHWVNQRGRVVGDPHAYLVRTANRQPPTKVTFKPSVFTRLSLWLHRNDVVRCDAGMGL